MDGILLIVVLVITGGAIAFIGDRLGSKVGKKKLSIFGLRPKHTSILVTILTGIAITTFTLCIMAFSLENVRVALFGLEEINRNMAEAKLELAKVSRELELSKEEQKNTELLLGQLEIQKKELEAGMEVLLVGNRELEALKGELSRENNKLLNLNIILENGNRALRDSNDNLLEKNKELRTGIQIMREGDIAFRAGEVLSTGIIKGGRDKQEILLEMDKILDVARYIAIRRAGGSESENENLFLIYQPDYEALVDFLTEHEGDFVFRVAIAGNFVRGEQLRSDLQLYRNQVIYKDKELILRKKAVFSQGSSLSKEEAIRRFLQEVNLLAVEKGILADPIDGTVGVVSGEQLYELMEEMEAISGEAILEAYADSDTNVMGPLRIVLRVAGAGK